MGEIDDHDAERDEKPVFDVNMNHVSKYATAMIQEHSLGRTLDVSFVCDHLFKAAAIKLVPELFGAWKECTEFSHGKAAEADLEASLETSCMPSGEAAATANSGGSTAAQRRHNESGGGSVV